MLNKAEKITMLFATNKKCQNCALALNERGERIPEKNGCLAYSNSIGLSKPFCVAFKGADCKHFIPLNVD